MELRSGVPSHSKRDDSKNPSKRPEPRNDSPRNGVPKQGKLESQSTLVGSKTLNQQELYPHRYLLRNNNLKEGNDQLLLSPLTISPKKSKKRKNNNLDSSSLTKSVINPSPKKKRLNTKKRNLAVKVSHKSNKSCNTLDSQDHQGSQINQMKINHSEKNDKPQFFTGKENNTNEDFKKGAFFDGLEGCIISRDESSSKDTDSSKDDSEESDSISLEKTPLVNYEAALRSQLSLSENPITYTQEDSYLVTSQRIAEALTILNSKVDHLVQILVLQNLSECLSVVSEDTMSSCTGKRALITALVQILKGGSTPQVSENSFSCYGGEDSAESMTLACRCLCNLMESFPPIIETIIKSGAIDILIIQLEDIKSIELAEQIVVALKIVSYNFSTIIVRNNGLIALLRHVDFYTTQVQRNSVIAVANCCKSVETIYFDKILEILPFIQNILNFPDIVVQEQVCLIFANITKSYCLCPNKLELIFSEGIIESFLKLLKPLNNTKMDVKSHLNLITLLNIVTSSSDVIADNLLKKNIISILYHNIFGEFSSDQIPSSYILSLSELVEGTLELSNNLLPELSNYKINHIDNVSDSLSHAGFCSVMAPVALKLFKVSNSMPIKLHCLTFIYKISVFSDFNSLEGVLTDLSIGSFLSSTIFNQENILFLRSLQIINCLIVKFPDVFIPIFSREGIFNELSELSKKSDKITMTIPDKSYIHSEVYKFYPKNQQIKLEKLNNLIDENFRQLLKTSSSVAHELKVIGDQLINPLIGIIVSTYLKSPNYIKSKSRNPVTVKLKSVARDLSIDNTRAKLEKSLMLLRDILFQNDLTTNELSSSKLIQYLQNFLYSKDGIYNEEPSKIFCDIFLASDEGLASLKNLVFLLQSRIDSLEDYEIITLRKEPIFMRCFIRNAKIVLYQDKIPSHAPHLLEMQLHEPTKLLVNHIMETLKEETSLENSNEWDKYDIQLKYKDIVLNKGVTLLKSLLQCGITAENIIQNTISLNYFKVIKGEESFVNVPEEIQEHKLKEFEVIFRLLRTIYYFREQNINVSCEIHKSLPSELFHNVKLTAKLDSQLNEDLVVACECLPEWCEGLINKFPFLFPTTVKLHFLQTSSYGADRLLTKISDNNSARQQERPLASGSILKSKILVSRQNLLKAAVKLFESYSHSRSILEIQFQDEAGSGQGPTLEFFSCIFQEFCRQDIGLWRHENSPASNKFVYSASGLFPRPRIDSELKKSAGKKILQYFKTLGWITAKSLMDSRVVDIPLNKLFLELVIFKNEKRSLSQADSLQVISLIDSSLANSLRCICTSSKNDCLLNEMCLTFVLPGYDIQLEEKGSKISVTTSNVDKFLERVIDLTIGRGIQYALNAFEQGFNCIFPLKNLQVFTLDELGTILGSKEEDWSAETIRSAMKADHGFSIPSLSITRLITILTNFTTDQRGLFLQFITGSRKLPIGGFHSLNPNLTVVKKLCDSSLIPDDYLPSVNTCFNYLKLPEYSSEKVMRERLLTAINEGKDSFHLS